MAERGRSSSGITYDERTGQCRDESGQFVDCPPELKKQGKSTREDPNKERVAAKGGEHSHGGGRGGSRRD